LYELAEKLGASAEDLAERITSSELTMWYGLWRVRAMEAEQARAASRAEARVRGR
jgi:hypothetical protein